MAPGQIQHHAADMAVTVAADVTLAAAQAQLADAGQWLALDGAADRPLGWLMQHDSTGPLRLGYGGWRDLITGIQFTDGRGDLVTVGGVTVKNVAGYDLVKFAVGSHGCFGRPVSLTLRTYRLPEAAMATWFEPSPQGVRALIESDSPPQWLLRTPEGLRAGWLGRERELAALAPVIREATGAELDVRRLADDEQERRQSLDVGIEQLRLCVAPTELKSLIEELSPAEFAADPVVGILWMRFPETFSDVLRSAERRG